MDDKKRTEISEILNRFPEVVWDRFVESGNHIGVYGWIERKGKPRDFVLLEHNAGHNWLTTSSARYSEEFGRRLNPHVPCQKVAGVFDVRAQ